MRTQRFIMMFALDDAANKQGYVRHHMHTRDIDLWPNPVSRMGNYRRH